MRPSALGLLVLSVSLATNARHAESDPRSHDSDGYLAPICGSDRTDELLQRYNDFVLSSLIVRAGELAR